MVLCMLRACFGIKQTMIQMFFAYFQFSDAKQVN